jgi:outer membrane lipoprotein-sorting protein
MSLYRRRPILPFTILLMFLLAACGSSSTSQAPPTPTPTPAVGQELLTKAAQKLNTAKTMHAIFDITIAGPSLNGTINTEVWNESPGKSRTVVLQSTITQVPTGSITVSDGKQSWQYDPVKKVVYNGPVNSNNSTTGLGRDQNQFIMNIVQSVFTHGNATLVSSNASVEGHAAYDVRVESTAPRQSSSTRSNTFNYNGDAYIDKTSMLPLRVKLTIPGLGQVTLDLPTLELNRPLAADLFTYVPPAGVKVLPFPKTTTADTGTITLAEAQQQAGYHLLSIPATQSQYQLQGVDALGAPGNQIFTLNYLKGKTTFAISEGKSLANLPGSGQQVSLRGTKATLTTSSGTMTLTWTEKGLGIQISGQLSNDEIVAIANSLS